MATPSLRVPLCERAALGGGWCRPPAAPSSGGGGAARSSQGQVLLRPESAVPAREVQHFRLRVGNLVALPAFMGRRVAGDPLSGAGLQSCGCVVGVGYRSRGRDSSSRYKLFGETRGFGDSAR